MWLRHAIVEFPAVSQHQRTSQLDTRKALQLTLASHSMAKAVSRCTASFPASLKNFTVPVVLVKESSGSRHEFPYRPSGNAACPDCPLTAGRYSPIYQRNFLTLRQVDLVSQPSREKRSRNSAKCDGDVVNRTLFQTSWMLSPGA